MQELQQEALQNQLQEQMQLQQQIEQLESVVKNHMSADAIARYGTLKAAHPEKAIQSLIVISQLMQSGRIQGQVTDMQYKQILQSLTEKKRETRITRK